MPIQPVEAPEAKKEDVYRGTLKDGEYTLELKFSSQQRKADLTHGGDIATMAGEPDEKGISQLRMSQIEFQELDLTKGTSKSTEHGTLLGTAQHITPEALKTMKKITLNVDGKEVTVDPEKLAAQAEKTGRRPLVELNDYAANVLERQGRGKEPLSFGDYQKYRYGEEVPEPRKAVPEKKPSAPVGPMRYAQIDETQALKQLLENGNSPLSAGYTVARPQLNSVPINAAKTTAVTV